MTNTFTNAMTLKLSQTNQLASQFYLINSATSMTKSGCPVFKTFECNWHECLETTLVLVCTQNNCKWIFTCELSEFLTLEASRKRAITRLSNWSLWGERVDNEAKELYLLLLEKMSNENAPCYQIWKADEDYFLGLHFVL